MDEFVNLSQITETGVGRFLCWPQYHKETFNHRLVQLQKLGVEGVALGGPHMVEGKRILGKGHVGIVIRGLYCGNEVALKIRRTDADRDSMEHEAKLLKMANNVDVGPKVYDYSNDFMVMQRVDGEYMGKWMKNEVRTASEIKYVFHRLLDQARSLDRIGLDHGELVGVKRHFIVSDGEPWIIDFESASIDRRVKNVTSVVQSLFLHSSFSKELAKFGLFSDFELLKKSLRQYKIDMSEENYINLLSLTGLA